MRVLLLLLLAGCGHLEMGLVAPRPTVNLGHSTERLTMVLPPSILDRFELETGAGWTLRVSSFRTSITNGYLAAFGRFYPLVQDGGDLILRFDQVSLELTPRLRLRYAVQLDDRQGRTLGRSFATLTGREITGTEEDALDDLLTRMFEKIAADCFVPLTTAPPRLGKN